MIRVKSKGRKVLRFALYGLYLLLVVGLLLEIALRIYNPFGMRIRGDKILLPIDQRVTITNRINPKLDSVIINTTNSMGFRGPELPAGFDSTLSLVTVGGSTTACSFLSNEHTWPFLLGKHLQENFRSVWLNNAGIDGHSSFGHQVMLSDHLVHIHPKVVLFLTGINDLENEEETFFDKLNIKSYFPDLKHYLYNNSEVINVVVNLFRGYRARKFNNTTHILRDPVADYSHTLTPEQQAQRLQEQDKYLPGYGKRIAGLIDTCLSRKIFPVFITQPLLYGAGIDSVTGVDLTRAPVPRYTNGLMIWNVLQRYNEKMKSVCREKNVPCIDLAAKMPKNSLYYYDGTHYTNKGAEVVAAIVDEELEKILATAFPGFKLPTFDATHN